MRVLEVIPMAHPYLSYLAPGLHARRRDGGRGWGVYAQSPFARGAVLVVWSGRVMPADAFLQLAASERRYGLQIEEQLYLGVASPERPAEPADLVNHSCDPSAGLSGQVTLVALRDIAPGDEITFDYAMSDGSPYDEFDCTCEAPSCRGRVTGEDWRRASLWEKYKGHFSPYLQRRIDRLRGGS